MVFTIFFAFISLVGLLVLHELGHFVLAKKFGVKVEEFGLGYPPRIIGKKIGETIYSLNLLPFGAFVRLYGEEKAGEGQSSFNSQKIWKRALIVFGGALSFWAVAAVLFSVVMGLGTPKVIEDTAVGNFTNPKVQIVNVLPDSPASQAGLKAGDTILKIDAKDISKVGEAQEITASHKGQKVILNIQRGKEVFDVSLTPRVSPKEGEGPMGVGLVRTALQKYPWYQAPIEGLKSTGILTWLIIDGYGRAIAAAFKGAPTGVSLVGPVGVFSLLNQASQMGVSYFLQFIAIISVNMALINLAPIPAVDGGKLLFLAIEKIRRKPVNEKTENRITAVFFMLLLGLMIFVTIKDIMRLF